MEIIKNLLIEKLEKEEAHARSAWAKGVYKYAFDLLDDKADIIQVETFEELKKMFLNGATSWSHYAWSGNGLCYDYAIAERLCTPSLFKQKKEGYYRPNKHQDWLDIEARALAQAFFKIKLIIKYDLMKE